MKKGNYGFNLDLLKDIILLYANTPQQPTEKLNDIEKALIDEKYRDTGGSAYQWEYAGVPYGILDIKIKLTIEVNKVEPQEAKKIFCDTSQKDAFIAKVIGYEESFPPKKKQLRNMFDSAFYELYRYTVASSCPCSLTKMNVLSQKGLVTASGGLNESKWTGPRLTCLECDHIQFVAALDDLPKDGCRYLEEILANYQRLSLEEAVFTGDTRRPIGKVIYAYEYKENDAAFPAYLDGLPCNLLIDYLAADVMNTKRIKRCPLCKKFFFAKDTKRAICYSDQCRKNYETKKKQNQRESDPVKYI